MKIWGTAKVVEGDADLIDKLMPAHYRARPEQVMLFTVTAWDANCPQHIPQRFEAADVAAALAERDQRIAELEAEVARLTAPAYVPARSGQWLSLGTPFVWATSRYLIAGFSTMPSSNWSTMPRWISCQGVWLCGT